MCVRMIGPDFERGKALARGELNRRIERALEQHRARDAEERHGGSIGGSLDAVGGHLDWDGLSRANGLGVLATRRRTMVSSSSCSIPETIA